MDLPFALNPRLFFTSSISVCRPPCIHQQYVPGDQIRSRRGQIDYSSGHLVGGPKPLEDVFGQPKGNMQLHNCHFDMYEIIAGNLQGPWSF